MVKSQYDAGMSSEKATESRRRLPGGIEIETRCPTLAFTSEKSGISQTCLD